MSLARCIEPELLDVLPEYDPRAMRARRDLRRVNAWMGQARIMQRLLLRHARGTPRTILELGGGDGTFMLTVARRLAWRDVTLLLLDRQDLVSPGTRAALRALGWTIEPIIGDVFDLLRQPIGRRVGVVTANLFLHHFAAEQLTWLAERAARLAPLFVATEPQRAAWPLFASHMLWAIGCNAVSRHDAVTSVRAGFRCTELSDLWPRQQDWALHEHAAGLFTHCFVARRRAAGTPM
jgi:hypothetical protein